MRKLLPVSSFVMMCATAPQRVALPHRTIGWKFENPTARSASERPDAWVIHKNDDFRGSGCESIPFMDVFFDKTGS